MLDVQSTAAAAPPAEIRREDYRPPDWLVPAIALDFALDALATRVRAKLTVSRSGEHSRPLRLDGDALTPLAVRVDGADARWRMDGDDLVVDLAGDSHIVETEVEIAPVKNTKLMGLYASGGNLCTQCEAEGFRRITFFPDRPDVLSKYHVRMEADRKLFPVLLCNGDPIASGESGGGRHWAEWNDPFPKPSYLFALVAGDLKANEDRFTTRSGRQVKLGIWVRQADLPKTAHAMAALKTAMKWDEEVYGREYDLDVFNIVAVDDFNFGAMENKGLNIFNSRYILADPDTATDLDYDGVLGVVAHEYFHNWSGNRVTCRDWFQLSLKEGFTVFRDQQFSADQGSAAVKRIEDVRMLRAAQFPEDAGPLAHPVRPESYLEIGNFYTATVYNKGAEVIRMMHTILGPERFRAATDLYFDRFDGTAATCEDFVRSMEFGSGVDLTQFRLWYSQAGTPKVSATLAHEGDVARLTLRQTVPPTPGQPNKAPMVLPLCLRLFGQDGPLGEQQLVMLDRPEQVLTFEGVPHRPRVSLNRGFSAPVIVETDRSHADLAFLSARDDDPFARYEAMQQLMLDMLVAAASGTGRLDHTTVETLTDAIGAVLSDDALDPAFKAEAVLLPSEALIGDRMAVVDPDAIAERRDYLRSQIGMMVGEHWHRIYGEYGQPAYEYTPAAKGRRRLRNVALGYIAAADGPKGEELAWYQLERADNMTDRLAALTIYANDAPDNREAAFELFYKRHRDNPLVIDKWFTAQALSTRDDVVEQVLELEKHPDFTLANPNRVRALAGAFSVNQRGFHRADGRGYRFLTDVLIALDKLNPQTAAKLTPPLGRWRRFADDRASLMRAELERLLATPGLSKDVFEQASKSLGD